MIKKTLTTFAAATMLLPVGFIIASPANASCFYRLRAPDGTVSTGWFGVSIESWRYSGSSVKPFRVNLTNTTNREVTVSLDRWQNPVTGLADRGDGGNYDNYESDSWDPVTYFPITDNPTVEIKVYATSRPGMGRSITIPVGTCSSLSGVFYP
jgi:hypothetical protein